MRFPDFYIVGAAKSGTTSLWYYLGQHPQIFMTKEILFKELGYFSPDYGIDDKETYLSFFKHAKDDQLIGESCHPYLSSPESAELIRSQVPNAKIIMILRNPVERAYSLYNYLIAVGEEPCSSFEKALALENKRMMDIDFIKSKYRSPYLRNYSYLQTGLYFEQVKRYLDIFEESRCKIILYDDLRKDKEFVFRNICGFLCIDDEFNPDFTNQNESLNVRFSYIQYFIRYIFPEKARKIGLKEKYINMIRNKVMKENRSYKKPRDLDPKLYNSLVDYFKNDIEKTAVLINRDLSSWLKYKK